MCDGFTLVQFWRKFKNIEGAMMIMMMMIGNRHRIHCIDTEEKKITNTCPSNYEREMWATGQVLIFLQLVLAINILLLKY